MDVDPRCPDCGVTMEEMTLRTGGGYETRLVSDETREGLLGSLGVKEKFEVEAFVCPECSLTRLYADTDDGE
jgi:hypothetical protein